MEYYERIKNLRLDHDKTQKEIAEILETGHSTPYKPLLICINVSYVANFSLTLAIYGHIIEVYIS